MDTYKYLLERYGVLMTLDELADILDRSADGLRSTVGSSTRLGQLLKKAYKKIGRRIHFKTNIVAQIIDSEEEL